MTLKEKVEKQLDEALEYMGKAWEGYKTALAIGKLEEASNYLSGFCTHLTTVERILDITHKAHELGMNPGVIQLPTVTIKGRKYYLDARLREYRAVDDPHVRIPLEPEYAKLLGEASVGSAAWNIIVESIIEEKQREARRGALPW